MAEKSHFPARDEHPNDGPPAQERAPEGLPWRQSGRGRLGWPCHPRFKTGADANAPGPTAGRPRWHAGAGAWRGVPGVSRNVWNEPTGLCSAKHTCLGARFRLTVVSANP